MVKVIIKEALDDTEMKVIKIVGILAVIGIIFYAGYQVGDTREVPNAGDIADNMEYFISHRQNYLPSLLDDDMVTISYLEDRYFQYHYLSRGLLENIMWKVCWGNFNEEKKFHEEKVNPIFIESKEVMECVLACENSSKT